MYKYMLFAFLLGDCIMLKSGIFKGSYWTITQVNTDGTFELQDRDWTLPKVRRSYLVPVDRRRCEERK